MTQQAQTEALRLADRLQNLFDDRTSKDCAAELRRLHARVQELEAHRAGDIEFRMHCYESHEMKRKPLTDWDIDGLKQGPSQSYRDFARAIERAHGIGAEKK